MTSRIRTVLIGAALFTGCAHARPAAVDSRAYLMSEVDVRPVLIGCADAQLPTTGPSNWVGVGVSFRLDERGVPQNVSTVGSNNAVSEYTGRAAAMVQSCRYKPAMLDGHAVAVSRMGKSVRVAMMKPANRKLGDVVPAGGLQ